MADTQEFLVKLINDWLETSELGSVDACESGEHPGLHGKLEVGGANPLVKAILQHFQQEQEKKPVRSIPIPFPSLYATDKEYLNAKEAYDKKVEEQWAGAERLYTQSEVDRLIREELELLMDRYTKIARKNTSIAISPLIIANRLVELSKQKEGGK